MLALSFGGSSNKFVSLHYSLYLEGISVDRCASGCDLRHDPS